MIIIRKHSREDIGFRVKWLNTIEAVRFAVDNFEKGTTLEEQEKWFDRYETDPDREFFTIMYDDKPIGFMGLSNIDRQAKSANLFILIGENDFRGRGFGQEALKWLIDYAWEELGLEIINLEVDTRNTSAIGLYEKLGFTVVGQAENELMMVLRK